MRERVRTATFKWTRDGRIAAKAPNGRNVCPLGIALDMWVSQPMMDDLFNAFDIQYRRGGSAMEWARQAVRDFTYLADHAAFDPANVYILLGCDSDALSAARQPEAVQPGSGS